MVIGTIPSLRRGDVVLTRRIRPFMPRRRKDEVAQELLDIANIETAFLRMILPGVLAALDLLVM